MSRATHIKRRILEHLIGPTGSILLHILIIYLAVHFIVFDTRESTPEIEVMIMEMESIDLDELLEEVVEEFEPLEFDIEFEMPDLDITMDDIVDVQDFVQESQDIDFAALDVIQVDSPLIMQGLFSGRSQTGRAELLRRYGGRWGELTEASVIRALEWLRINQNENGSWSHGGPPSAMTGLGLLTFLAHGETTSSERYGRTVRRAINYLMEQQEEDGNFRLTGSHHVYGNAIAAYAITEAYALTRIPALRIPMDRAIQAIIDGQQPQGGWDYDFKKEERRDTSVSAFNIQALKAADLAGSSAQGIQDAMRKSIEDLRGVYNPEIGAFGYTGRPGGPNLSMTAIGTLLFQLTGHARAPEVRPGVELVRRMAQVDWDEPGPWPMYRWYYITQVMFQTGGSTWSAWNNQFAPAFVKNQNPDGSWTSPGEKMDYQIGRENYGPVYATTFAALSLQVYYRILPTFAVVEQPEEESDAATDDIVVEIL